jgi:Domain of unknown function (DUF1737)
MEYIIVQEGDLATLSKTVSAHIEQGWKPQGGVCSFETHETLTLETTWTAVWFCQALVK